MTTEQAFILLINDEEYIKSLPVKERRSIFSYRNMYKKGLIKMKKMNVILERHGFKLVSNPDWIKIDK